MDANRFDAMVRALVAQTSRRRTLSLVLGGALGFLGLAESEAGKSRKCKPKCNECQYCRKGTCKKKNGKKTCKPGKCKPKGDGVACTVPTGGTCQGGVCTCPTGLTTCSGVCVDTQADESNCGACGTACSANQVCQRGACFPKDACPATQTDLCAPAPTPCGPGCFCGPTTEGNVVCVTNAGIDCETLTGCADSPTCPHCTTSADCPAGSACVPVSGCGCGPGVKICLAQCPAPTPPREAAAAVEGTSGGLLSP